MIIKKIIILFLFLFPILIIGQSNSENYIKTVAYKTQSTTVIASPTISQASENITYFDGLGRPIQQIASKQSPTGNDIIVPIEYDAFGRQEKEYLPYASTQSNSSYIDPATLLANLKAQYQTNYGASNDNPYSQKQLEASPLDRVLKQAASGYDWRINGGHEIKFDYQTNTASEVINFKVSLTIANNTYSPTLSKSAVNNGFYNEKELYKTIIYNENTAASPLEGDGSTVEFKNKEGQVILKRTFGTSMVNGISQNNIAHDTYYVYDIYGNLTFVIPPKAVDLISNSSMNVLPDETSTAQINSSSNPLYITATNSIRLLDGFHAQAGSTFSAKIVNSGISVLKESCYQYVYDNRNRLVEKKLPGKDWEYIVYDKLDRVILTQDANLRTDKKWLFTKYDAFSRPVYTGEYTNTLKTTRVDMQLLVAASTSVFETRQAANTINGTTVYYTNNAFPAINDVNINLFTINYYDDYNFDALPSGTSVISYGITPTVNVKDLPTGSRVRILGKPNWITNWNYYDDKGRPIYSYSKNDYLGTTSIVKSQLDFVGKTLDVTSLHIRNSITTTIKDTFTYDHAGRITKQEQAINGATPPEIIAANTYDELGQLIIKKVGGKTVQGLQTVNYAYNIRGWLKNINDVNTIDTDLFAFQINYNDITDNNKKLFNGNISQTFWKTANIDPGVKSYTYSYDKLNRLTDAVDNLNKFTESLNYDQNGNITNLVRQGEIVGGVPYITNPSDFGIMDNLKYSYDIGNQLQVVSDSANDTYGFRDDQIGTTADSSNDYTYDPNGNMKSDTNKGITAIQYNHLNLPMQVTIAGQNIKYEYDAGGVKQQKTANGIVTDYAGGFIYEGNQLKFFSQPEGYVSYNSGTFDYIYQYKDHLGNVRLSYDKNLNIIEENNYYPFGLKQKGYNNATVIGTGNATAQKYKYNGKELQDELGLNMYDYGWRNYDSTLGRWMNIDNMAEKYVSVSPYHYAGNNPVLNLDVDGNEFTESAWKWVNKLITDINSRQEKNNKGIADFQSRIAKGGSDREIARWNRNINSLTANNTELETARGESAVLAASNQVYNVIEDSNGTESDAIGNKSTTNSTNFNFANGNIDISVSSGTSVGLFAHELKHAFQFETGSYSIGPELSGVPYKNLFYDKNDEVEAYQRGALFGDRNNYNANNLPAEYSGIATGPYNFNNVQPTSSTIGSPNQQQNLQNIANRIRHAFRIDGRTYFRRR